ncbi:MAG TPA: hypothetical protein VNJ06_07990 [Gemmatimonadales bacterium]|nr:hypothetical protein [Gemmatimonadales bacterium]
MGGELARGFADEALLEGGDDGLDNQGLEEASGPPVAQRVSPNAGGERTWLMMAMTITPGRSVSKQSITGARLIVDTVPTASTRPGIARNTEPHINRNAGRPHRLRRNPHIREAPDAHGTRQT